MLLKDKVAIVTGGGKGIGRAIALAYAKEGADVVVAARTESALKEVAAEIEAMGRKTLVVVSDFSDNAQPPVVVEKAMEAYGKVDILVNNSGWEGPIMNVHEMDLDGWNRILAINLTASMLCARYVLEKSMISRQSGIIINISSGQGRRGFPKRSAYSSTKFGLIGLTQSLASEVGQYGIRVNCIAPGAVQGERIQRIIETTAKSMGLTPEEYRAKSGDARSPLGRIVTEEEVADLAVYLASDKSSGITGQTINIDAGSMFN
jgi:NAD(P)-dependent dehydrogenase (short-subunit alcohol dehydrogenase family)